MLHASKTPDESGNYKHLMRVSEICPTTAICRTQFAIYVPPIRVSGKFSSGLSGW